MADIPQVLANYDALVGGVLGASLAYGFGALNRRHQEAREKETRWYQARFEAFSAVLEVLTKGIAIATRGLKMEDANTFLVNMTGTLGRVRFVGSDEVVDVSDRLFSIFASVLVGHLKGQSNFDAAVIEPLLTEFIAVARKDLGHPKPLREVAALSEMRLPAHPRA